MRLPKLLVIALLLLVLPTVAQAADQQPEISPHLFQEDSTELATMTLPNFGLTFQYPANWESIQDQSFDFVLVVATDDAGGITEFMGLQSLTLREDETMMTYFEQFASTYSSEVEEIEFAGLDALSMPLPPNENGGQGLIVGFMPSPSEFALFIFSGQTATWETFEPQINAVLASAEVVPLDLDVAALDAQLLTNFEEEKVLRLGNPDSTVKMVEVLDFSCPHCAEYAGSIERVIQDYVMTDKIALEFHLATFVGDELSQAAAEAQYCAASLGYGWQVHEMLFDIQRTEGPQSFTTQYLTEQISALEGMDGEAFGECLTEGRYTELVERDAQFIEDTDVNGTPALLFASGEETPALLRDSSGNPLGGGLRLTGVYSYLDSLLADTGF